MDLVPTPPGKDPANGRFLPGNRCGKGRPVKSPNMCRTYVEAISHSCPPAKVAAIVEAAVEDALSKGPGRHAARALIFRVIGADQIRLVLAQEPAASMSYCLGALSDEEQLEFDRLTAKMLIPPNGDGP